MGGADASITTELEVAIQALADAALDERPLIEQLWSNGRLQPNPARPVDMVDELAARLASVSVARETGCALILPSVQPDRGPLLLATALLTHWWRGRLGPNAGSIPRSVLYVGGSAGVRTSLERTVFRGGEITLGEFFGQNDQSAPRTGRRGRATPVRAGLPEVVVAYAPPDPAGLVRRHRPAWVAVDLTGGRDATWLPALANQCSESGLPILAWTDNPVAPELQVLAGRARIVSIPPARLLPDGSYRLLQTEIRPLLMKGEVSDRIAGLFGQAGRDLVAALRAAPSSRLVGDAVRAHWSLLRHLEYLPCPLDFWEANVAGHWGLRRIADMRSSCDRFAQAVRVSYGPASDPLGRAGAALSEVIDLLGAGNPRWDTVVALCVDGAPVGDSIEVNFVSRGRRSLFAEALLARFGFTESDLESVRVSLGSVSTGRDYDPEARRRVIFAGGVSAADSRVQRYLLACDAAEILVYESGLRRLLSVGREMSEAGSTEKFQDALRAITGSQVSLPNRPARISLGDITAVEREGQRRDAPTIPLVDGVLGADEELARLLGEGHEPADESTPAEAPDRDAPVAVDAIVSVDYADGWHADYELDQTVMVVERNGLGVRRVDRPARDLAVGDEVIAIHGQQRQSLYELLIARLHRNPGIELHLALLERWQGEVDAGYAGWSGRGRTLEDLLRAMQAKGSDITSISGVRLWVTGRTLAPQDAADVRRLGEVLERPFVVDNFVKISNAASRLRGLHRGLAHRLDNWLEDEATRAGAGSDALIDADAGIRFSDFRGSLLHLNVTALRIETGIFLPYRLGIVERGTLGG